MSDDVEVTVTLPGTMVDYLRHSWVAEDRMTYLDTGPGAVCYLLAAALRPPKMDEPTLLGTVVLTDDGLAILADKMRKPWWRAQEATWAWWDELTNPWPATPADIERWSE